MANKQATESLCDKYFSLGKVSQTEELSIFYKNQAGKSFGDWKEEEAIFFRNLYIELKQEARVLRIKYDKDFPKE